MKIIDRYIAKNVLASIGLVTLLLVGLQLFILFVNELDDLGRNDYGIVQAFVYVLLQMPYQVYLFFPIASLLGSLVGLGMMANNSELIVLRGCGFSIGQITASVLKAALVLTLLVTILGETIVPSMSRYAHDYKGQALSGGQSLRTEQGMWLRYGLDFISIGTIHKDMILNDIYQFKFNDEHQLIVARFIKEAKFEQGLWTAYEVSQTEFNAEKLDTKTLPSLHWEVPLKPQILKISSQDPDEMTLYELGQYLSEKKREQQKANTHRLVFYQRLIQPFSTMVMVILAIPFIFGPLRSSTMGSKLLVGATIGFSFHILNHFLGPFSLVFQWPPLLAAVGPTVIFAMIGFYLMRRVR